MEEASACSSLISALLLPPFDSAEKIVENTFFLHFGVDKEYRVIYAMLLMKIA